MKYDIVWAYSVDELISLVNERVAGGWALCGGVNSHVNIYELIDIENQLSFHNAAESAYHQAMVIGE